VLVPPASAVLWPPPVPPLSEPAVLVPPASAVLRPPPVPPLLAPVDPLLPQPTAALAISATTQTAGEVMRDMNKR